MEEKEILLKVPQGKKAEWNEEGYLQLVDEEHEQPKDITERVKTFYDAQCELEQWAERGDCEARQLIKEYNSVNTEETSDDIVAYMQLRIITAALNEGWRPKFKEGETRWFPYFVLYTKKDIDKMSYQEKDDCKLLLFGGVASIDTDCDSSSSRWEVTSATLGCRLTYKTQNLAAYAARQFASVYARFYIGDKAKDAKPWREFEKQQNSYGTGQNSDGAGH